MPYGYNPYMNNNCHCSGDMNDILKRINQLENRINRLENMIYSNNYNQYNTPSYMNADNRNYTTMSYMI